MVGAELAPYLESATLSVDPTTYALLKLKPGTRPEPALLKDALMWFHADNDPTLVVPLETARAWKDPPAGLLERDDGWRRVTLDVEVPLNIPGFIRVFANALAQAGISILPISGYRYDHLLIHQVNLERAVATLDQARTQLTKTPQG